MLCALRMDGETGNRQHPPTRILLPFSDYHIKTLVMLHTPQ